MSSDEPNPAADPERSISQADFDRIQASDEFVELRRRFRTFAFPMTVAFVAWYFLYVLLSTYAVGFMSIPLIGYLNVGMVMGLAQFATTFGLTWLYVRHANRNLDPLAERLRDELEGEA